MTRSPLLYLTVHTVRNRLRVRLRRLREPRYLFATIIGVAYFSFIVFGRGGRGSRVAMRAISGARDVVELGATILLFVAAAFAWIWPRPKAALPFTRAEVQHLFTAPISRSDLIRYRVLRSQVGTLAASFIMTVLLRPTGSIEAATTSLGLIVLMATINMHLTAVSLSRASHGARGWMPRLVAAAAVVIVVGTVATHWTDLTMASAGGELVAEIDRLSSSGAAGIVLWPFRAIARLPMAASLNGFVAALPAALALLILNYLWVLRTNAPFEEASAELSEKLDAIRKRGPVALRPARTSKRTPFTLTAHGRPETAILWKNLISMGRVVSWSVLIRILPMIVLLSVAVSRGRGESAKMLTGACLMVAGFTTILGPQMTRSDLRQDLTALAVLKTWPIRGAALVRGEILAPAIVLTAIVFLALIAAMVASLQVPFDQSVSTRVGWLIAALLVAPGIVLAQLITQNGLAVTFPSWINIGGPRGGVDVVGQRLLVMVAVLLTLVVAVLPAAIVAAIGAGILYLLTGIMSFALAGVLAGAALLVEAFAGSEILGAILERSDISAIDAPES